jgi:hypothetical protein
MKHDTIEMITSLMTAKSQSKVTKKETQIADIGQARFFSSLSVALNEILHVLLYLQVSIGYVDSVPPESALDKTAAVKKGKNTIQ